MSDKKHIDRLFQERFKDFEATPNPAVWNTIEARLKKKKRRGLPLWWRYAGIAALLLVLLTIGIHYFNTEDHTVIPEIVDTNSDATRSIKTEGKTELNSDKDEKIDHNSSQNTIKTPNTAITSHNTKKGHDAIKNSPSQKNETLSNNRIKASNKAVVAKNNIDTVTTSKANPSNIVNNANVSISKESTTDKKENALLIHNNKTEEIEKNNTIANNETTKTESKQIEIKEKTRRIEDALNNTEDAITKKEEVLNRWRLATNVAPVYFNTLGEGSSIDPTLNANSKSGELNMSYGVSASYAINKKVSIRSGVNKVNLGYNTNDVVVFEAVGLANNSRALQNVDIIQNDNPAYFSDNPETVSYISYESLANKSRPESLSTNTTINQNLGYIEIPLEIQYRLIDKKFGIQVIGGFSTFFLNNNDIYSSNESSGETTFLGKANNINNISYSANIGMGINYNVLKKIDLKLEPIFKYQINTFNNTSGDFKPYFIGVYTGFAIKF